jgi:tetratricopeptide (TPR) repeat protein
MERKLKDGLPIEEYDAVIRRDPNNVEAYILRGIAYANKGDDDKAMADYNQAIQLDPNEIEAYVNRGCAYFNTDINDKALTDFDQAIRLDPNDARAYYFRGWVYLMKDDFDKAIAEYSQAIDKKPDYIDAYKKRAEMYKAKKDYDRAIADFDQVIRLKPNDAEVYKDRGVAYIGRGVAGDNVKAIADFDQAIKIKPDYAQAYFARGQAYGDMGTNDTGTDPVPIIKQAIADVETALRLGLPDERWIRVANGTLGSLQNVLQNTQRLQELAPALAEELKRHAEQERIEKQRREEEERIEKQRQEEEEARKAKIKRTHKKIAIAAVIAAICLVAGFIVFNSPKKSVTIPGGVTVIPESPASTNQQSSPTSSDNSQQNQNSFQATHKVVTDDGSNLRLRDAAGFNASQIGSLGYGSSVRVLEVGASAVDSDGNRGNWTYVSTPDGKTGWCFGAYLQVLSQ